MWLIERLELICFIKTIRNHFLHMLRQDWDYMALDYIFWGITWMMWYALEGFHWLMDGVYGFLGPHVALLYEETLHLPHI